LISSVCEFVEKMLTTVRNELMSSDCNTEYYPFGNTRVRNVFKDFYLGGKIYSNVNKVTKVFTLRPTIINFLYIFRLFFVEAVTNLLSMFVI
jgi:hypothetical protein